MSKNKIEFGSNFNFKNQFLRDKSVDDIKQSIDMVEGLETITYTLFKYGVAAVTEGTVEIAARLLKAKGINAAHNSSLFGIVIDGDEEVNEQIKEDIRFVRDAVSFSMSKDNEREMIVHTMKFEKSLTGSQRSLFMDDAYKYKESHKDISMVEAKFEVSKVFKV